LSLQKLITINTKDVHAFSPAGGIHILSVEEVDEKNPQVFYEQLVFVQPQVRFNEQAVAIRTNYAEDAYAPGDLTDLTVTIDTAQLGNYNSDEDLFASVTVTDVSSLLKVPSYKQQPSLPTMIYLEKEVKLVGEDYDEEKTLEYSSEFIDSNFNLDTADDTDNYSNLDLLLGV
jgi:hypothetical protein